jgi:hypothetical protein
MDLKMRCKGTMIFLDKSLVPYSSKAVINNKEVKSVFK